MPCIKIKKNNLIWWWNSTCDSYTCFHIRKQINMYVQIYQCWYLQHPIVPEHGESSSAHLSKKDHPVPYMAHFERQSNPEMWAEIGGVYTFLLLHREERAPVFCMMPSSLLLFLQSCHRVQELAWAEFAKDYFCWLLAFFKFLTIIRYLKNQEITWHFFKAMLWFSVSLTFKKIPVILNECVVEVRIN